jgi:hypothetical protein
VAGGLLETLQEGWMYRAGILGVALILAAGGGACTEPSPSDDDGPSPDSGADGGDDGDDGGGTAGLGVTFWSDPGLPGDVGGDFSPHILREATLELEDVRATGDSATGPGTTKPNLVLHWGGGGGEDDGGEGDDGEEDGSEEDGGEDGSEDEDGGEDGSEDEGGEDDDEIGVFFDDAPVGIYSTVQAEIVSYQMSGTLVIEGGGAVPFEIAEVPPTPIAVSIELSGGFPLREGESRTIRIRTRLRDAVREPRWDEVAPGGGGVLVIDGASDQIGTVREKLGQDTFRTGEDE